MDTQTEQTVINLFGTQGKTVDEICSFLQLKKRPVYAVLKRQGLITQQTAKKDRRRLRNKLICQMKGTYRAADLAEAFGFKGPAAIYQIWSQYTIENGELVEREKETRAVSLRGTAHMRR